MGTTLVKPNGKRHQYGNLSKLSAIEPPLWMAIFANHYKADRLIDLEAKPQKVVGDRIVIFATGNHPSAYKQQYKVACKLKKKLGKGKIINRLPKNPIECGSPRWDLLDMSKYRAHNWHCWGGRSRFNYGTIYTSVSCPFSCKFCVIKKYYPTRYLTREPRDVIKDFETLQTLGITNIKILDEIFLLNTKRVREILRNINAGNAWCYARIDTVNERLLKLAKKAGIEWICYGIETADEGLRRTLGKGAFDNNRVAEVVKMTKDAGIKVLGNFMFGFPKETPEDRERTFHFAQKLLCEYANFYCLVDYNRNTNVAQYSKNFKSTARHYRDKAFDRYFKHPEYLAMMTKVFGVDVLNEIKEMTDVKLERT